MFVITKKKKKEEKKLPFSVCSINWTIANWRESYWQSIDWMDKQANERMCLLRVGFDSNRFDL